MTGNDDFRVRPGRIRSTRAPRTKPFLAQALQAAQKAGGLSRRPKAVAAGLGAAAPRALPRRECSTTAPAAPWSRRASSGRCVRPARCVPISVIFSAMASPGMDRPGKLFDAAGDEADGRAFAERCEGDRHHFRFIVSPDDAGEFGSLRSFTRELMDQASRDLGTRLDWVAIDHWNTEHPHIHILVRGRADDGKDLVISRDYISTGLRARAGDLVTRELGPRSELEVRRSAWRPI